MNWLAVIPAPLWGAIGVGGAKGIDLLLEWTKIGQSGRLARVELTTKAQQDLFAQLTATLATTTGRVTTLEQERDAVLAERDAFRKQVLDNQETALARQHEQDDLLHRMRRALEDCTDRVGVLEGAPRRAQDPPSQDWRPARAEAAAQRKPDPADTPQGAL